VSNRGDGQYLGDDGKYVGEKEKISGARDTGDDDATSKGEEALLTPAPGPAP
jgi:hypothetical protein